MCRCLELCVDVWRDIQPLNVEERHFPKLEEMKPEFKVRYPVVHTSVMLCCEICMKTPAVCAQPLLSLLRRGDKHVGYNIIKMSVL